MQESRNSKYFWRKKGFYSRVFTVYPNSLDKREVRDLPAGRRVEGMSLKQWHRGQGGAAVSPYLCPPCLPLGTHRADDCRLGCWVQPPELPPTRRASLLAGQQCQEEGDLCLPVTIHMLHLQLAETNCHLKPSYTLSSSGKIPVTLKVFIPLGFRIFLSTDSLAFPHIHHMVSYEYMPSTRLFHLFLCEHPSW